MTRNRLLPHGSDSYILMTGVVKHAWAGPLPHTAASSPVVQATGARERRADQGWSMGQLNRNGAHQHSHVVFATDFSPAGLHVP